ncbi:MAG TPA: methylated-DNA--[protein]-cysteine S-methyltransferase [Alphaproteobacteria bacterium]|nr:methylated-DNA--[protein]-cysteine S-methyltransferase [Alphaproteobacteria bacterium]
MNDVALAERPESHQQVDDIRYAVANCALGRVLVAASAQGLCAVFLGDAGVQLREDLKRTFPDAHLVHAEPGFHDAWVAPVVRLIDAPMRGERLGLPIAVHGTPLQRRVWEALCEIPPGETRSYGDIAAKLGLARREAPREVAAACAANMLAVVIPCHRVVAADGRLSGYRWGIARKARLLAREGARLAG